MGYHMTLYNKNHDAVPIQLFTQTVQSFGFYQYFDEHNQSTGFQSHQHEDWTIFFDEHPWINTTDDDLINIFIEILKTMGSEFYIIGDHGEQYIINQQGEVICLDEECSQPFDLTRWLIILFCCILLGLAAWLYFVNRH